MALNGLEHTILLSLPVKPGLTGVYHQAWHPLASTVILSFDLITAHICVFQFQSSPWNSN